MTRKAFVALTLLGAVASPALAAAPPGMRWMITHEGDRIAATPVNEGAAAPDRVEGKVVAIDPQHGSFLLGTDAGMIALYAAAEDLAELQIGQTLEVEVIGDEEPVNPSTNRS
jgi:hypothetical protein